jgi:hypothetical protein
MTDEERKAWEQTDEYKKLKKDCDRRDEFEKPCERLKKFNIGDESQRTELRYYILDYAYDGEDGYAETENNTPLDETFNAETAFNLAWYFFYIFNKANYSADLAEYYLEVMKDYQWEEETKPRHWEVIIPDALRLMEFHGRVSEWERELAETIAANTK